MKKKIIVFVASVLCINMMFPAITYATEAEKNNGEKLREIYEHAIKAETIIEDDINIIDKLNEEYFDIQNEMIIEEGENGSVVYMDEYAGAYIENDKLIVCVTETKKMEEDTEEIKYKLVDNSYNDLLEMQGIIEDLYSSYYEKYDEKTKEYELISGISGLYIDEKANRIVVDIVNLDNNKTYIFEELFGKNESVQLEKVERGAEDCTLYKPGRAIYAITSRNGGTITYIRCSMGYRAYRQTSVNSRQTGFVTCAHGIRDSVDNNVYSSSSFDTIIGTIEAFQYAGTVDASFIKTATGNVIGTNVQYDQSGGTSKTDTLKSFYYMLSIATGSTVHKVGSTTYKTSAKVTSTNFTVTINGNKFTNLTKTEQFVESGDSGGVVYMYYDSENLPAGIIKGNGSGLFSSYSFFVKASEIIKYMNVYPY